MCVDKKIVLSIDNVSKRYCRNLKKSMFYGIVDIWHEITLRGQKSSILRKDEFWALKGVSFQLKKGESLGLIGHNGAGKTTLLKMINGLIKPNNGSIRINGSIRALIALGTGFNPILSGRENIKISAAILGYSKQEIATKYEEILKFSELEEFIDMPIKSYSSGMLARLGFSVAIHMDPEILLVDEVLAVGDLNFVLKCYRKIAEFRKKGGSIILVSHSNYAIRANCDRVIWLEKGVIQKVGPAAEVCTEYELDVAKLDIGPKQTFLKKDILEITDLNCTKILDSGTKLRVSFKILCKKDILDPLLTLVIFSVNNQNLVTHRSNKSNGFNLKRGLSDIEVEFPYLPLNIGVYTINLVIADGYQLNQYATLYRCLSFRVNADPKSANEGVIIIDSKCGVS